VARFLDGYRALLRWIARVERGVVAAMLAAIVAGIFAQVVSRYLFGRPLVWVEELSTYCFIWGSFVGAALGLKQDRHIRILSFVGGLRRRPRLLIRAATDLAIGTFCVLLVANGLQAMLLFEWAQRTIALPVELPRLLFYSLPLVVASTSMALTALYDLLLVGSGRAELPRAAPPAL
jgi:TRAP-type C4-dicarboxylate transport system permease small subunit